MPEMSDMALMQDYDRRGSEAAFATLVQRHVSLVYSVALRHVGTPAQAEEITQAVFIILARKAGGLRPDTILEGWLHETTRLTALRFLRGERRRRFREQEAYMQSTPSEAPDASVWNQLAPMLDEALSCLGQKDRDAVMLRFLVETDTASAPPSTEALKFQHLGNDWKVVIDEEVVRQEIPQ
jgi:RNA polymerase sigma factor (sigma-70 family)